MLPESMDCQRCGSNFLLDMEERIKGVFECTICHHLNIFETEHPVSSKIHHKIGDLDKYTCSKCTWEVEKNDKFCANCGANVADINNENHTFHNIRRCNVCQSNVKASDKICWQCGNNLAGENPSIHKTAENCYTNTQVNHFRLQDHLNTSNTKVYNIKFTGNTREYFQIWIINLILTIFTFGIYAAWAKVRTRKYFYNSTWLDNQHFDYKANPKGIFIGYLILGTLLFLYYFTNFLNPLLSVFILIIGAIFFPFLVYKSHRFFAHNSSYRNLRFSFFGEVGDSYIAYLLIPLGIPITLGFIVPFWDYYRKKYSFSNFGFGTLRSNFSGSAGSFYKYYFILGLFLAVYFISFIVVITIMIRGNSDALTNISGFSFILMYAIILFFYQIGLIIYRQYLYSRLTNYTLNFTNFGDVKFKSTLQFRELFKIQLTNLFAIVFSLGLLIPWAKIRRTKYIFDNISIISQVNFDKIESLTEKEENALGNVTTDYFELEIGL